MVLHGERLDARRTASALAACMVLGLMLALPGTALARSSTRLVVPSSVTIHDDVKGVVPGVASVPVKLQKKSGTRWVGLSGTVKVYKYDPNTKKYVYKLSKKGSSFTLSLSLNGKYQLKYAQTGTTKAATSYTIVNETIGLTLSEPVITCERIGTSDEYWLNVRYDVDWNTDVWPYSVDVRHEGLFYEDVNYTTKAWVLMDREVAAPGKVEFNYKFYGTEYLPSYHSFVGSFAGSEWAFIVTPVAAEHDALIQLP